MTAMPGSILDRAVQREGLKGHDGRSGAVLERVVLDDGTRLVVKTAAPGTDLPGAATGDPGRELWLWSTGILGRLPPGAGHAIVDGWETGDGTIITVMRDLGDAVVGRRGPITRSRCRRILGAAAAVHRRFAGQHVARLCPLERRLTLFSPRGIAAAGGDNQLAALVARGWEYFAEIAPPDIVAEVFAVFDDPEPLANELRRGGSTLIHGDLWLVNVALPPRGVVLLDWGLATEAPAAVELASFLAGNASSVHATREQIIDDFRDLSGGLHHEPTLRLAMLAGLVELGWNKALDIAENPKIAERERADLAWWVTQARVALDTTGITTAAGSVAGHARTSSLRSRHARRA